MYKQHRSTRSWSLIACGVAMLFCVALIASVKLASMIGIGKAVTSFLGGILVAAGLIVGVILIVCGLNKM